LPNLPFDSFDSLTIKITNPTQISLTLIQIITIKINHIPILFIRRIGIFIRWYLNRLLLISNELLSLIIFLLWYMSHLLLLLSHSSLLFDLTIRLMNNLFIVIDIIQYPRTALICCRIDNFLVKSSSSSTVV